MTWFVYILKCSDGSYYNGYTKHMVVRMQNHHSGHACQIIYSSPSGVFGLKLKLKMKIKTDIKSGPPYDREESPLCP
ncbi:GIY-YIG nuclease family protein [candidate division CSSED10-310 bacterium]|uniref:GIY-YIG nuclease family protein n=1 Tax=candidate division CSSED10-310 bacterium TaxID=2855610 RepID=A0ABV6Z1N9_UNCC1